jgi:uncharacterized circularly permuted ATP-grasp superfamily protein
MEDVLSNYLPGDAFDEMIDMEGSVRPSYKAVYTTLRRSTSAELRAIADALAHSYTQAGVTFDIGGVERPFPLDLVPRVIAAPEWDTIETGVAQRVRALEAFLADIYAKAEVIADGVIPSELVTSSTHFHRAVWGVEPPNGVRIHVAGVDLVRTPDGDVRVLEDNVRVPSGVSYVMTNRTAMITAMPDAFSNQRIRPVAGYPQRLLAALRKAAPGGGDDPTVVVLTPGVFNSAYFEHTLLARTMGVELVEGRDLQCHRGKVFMRTTAGLQRVDVIYRRVDDEFIDPVHFRSDSMLGVPGLINAVRTGGVALANAIGNGVADDKLVYTYVPDLIRYYLHEKPILANVDTWRLEEPEARAEVLDRLEELVVKPVDGSGGKGIVIGPRASRAELDALRSRVTEDPRGWIAQPVVQLSTVPTLIEDRLRPRHVDLRPFAVNSGDSVWVLPGGLTRVALPEGELVVNSSQGGGSKDTWVLSPPTHHVEPPGRRGLLRVEAPETGPDDDHVRAPDAASAVPLSIAAMPATLLTHRPDRQRVQLEPDRGPVEPALGQTQQQGGQPDSPPATQQQGGQPDLPPAQTQQQRIQPEPAPTQAQQHRMQVGQPPAQAEQQAEQQQQSGGRRC